MSTFHAHGLDSGIVSVGTLWYLLEEKKYYKKVTLSSRSVLDKINLFVEI